MRIVAFILCLALALYTPTTVGSAGFSSTIQLTANPEAINADGKSIATISAEVRDSSGNLVSDGTMVNFTTSLGTIESSVGTAAGVARATLRSGTAVGTALISATLANGGAVAQRKVELLPQGVELKGRSFVTISTDKYLIYSVDKRVMESLGGVRVLYRGTSIDADSAQFDIDKMVVRARQKTGGDPIRISRSGKTIQASLLYYELGSGKGVVITTPDDGAKRQLISTNLMELSPDDSEDPKAGIFDFADLSDTVAYVKAKSITLREGQDMQFRRAEVYVGEKKVISIPLHVIPLNGQSGLTGQMLSVGTTGLKVDVPLYYALSPSFAGALRVKNQQAGGWGYYGTSPGWFMDLDQQYSTGLTGQGTLSLTRITGKDWGVKWTHNQDFDTGSRVYSYVDFPSHRDLYGMMSYTKPLNGCSLGLNLSGNKYHGSSTTATSDLYLQTDAKPLVSDKVNYSVTARSSYSTQGFTGGGRLGEGLQLQLFGSPIKVGGGPSLSTSLSVGQDWGGRYTGSSILGTASMTQQLGGIGQAGLIYSYNRTPGILSGRHRLSGNMFITPSSRLQTNIYTTLGIDDKSISAFHDINYRFNGGWSLGALSTYQKFQGDGFLDVELALGKQVGSQDITLIWSQSQKRFRLEFGALKF